MASTKKKFRLSKKKEHREKSVFQKKQDSEIIEILIDKYKSESSEDLIKLSKKLILELATITDMSKIKEKELEYEALINIMSNRHIYNYELDLINYPDYEDEEFNRKIYSKKEFYFTKTKKIQLSSAKEKEQLSKKLCDPLYDTLSPDSTSGIDKNNIFFNLTPNQKFLKLFLSPNTPYNSLLLFHGTGVGKTCTSISIVEQYSEELRQLNKKIIILLNPSIKDNFIKNIFNIEKVKKGLKYYQCTGDKYINEIADFDKLSNEKIQQKVNKIIKSKYEFYGYQEFANKIEKIKNKITASHDNSNISYIKIKNKIKELYSNSIFIIDEAHNIKDSKELKVLPPLLDMVFKYADNIKLLELSATPMFDNSLEIIWLINLLLRNDKKPILKKKDYFDTEGNLLEHKINEFIRKIRGYISYVRGENPYRFPERIYPKDHPKILQTKMLPIKDKHGKDIPESHRITELNLINCPMDGFQKDIYNKMKTSDVSDSFAKNSIMCSNITYFNDNPIDSLSVESVLGDTGLTGILTRTNAKYNFKNDKYANFFKLENIKNFSSKIHHILDNIDKLEGIVFIYSKFINAGVVPLALALEYNGYSKYDNSLLKTPDPTIKKKGNYIIISGDKELSKNSYKDYIGIQNENKNGELVKIIIGSETASEGLDFSYIRHIYIFDPWFHLNKIEQVIGRGIRNCSHIDLPPEKRNVTIYLLVATLSDNPSNDNETNDIEIYRKAEIKSKQMAEVEYIIKRSAIDCNLNLNSNIFENDIDYSKKCNYKKCNYKCIDDLPDLSNNNLNSDTWLYNKYIIDTQIDDIVKLILIGNNEIRPLFKIQYFFSIEEIVKLLKQDKKLIYLALNKLILNKTEISRNDKKGNLIYKNGLYIFVPLNLRNKYITYNNIRTNKKIQPTALNISRNKMFKTSNNNNNNNNNKAKSSSNIDNSLLFIEDFKVKTLILWNCLTDTNLVSLFKIDNSKQVEFTYKYYLYNKATISYNLDRRSDDYFYNNKKTRKKTIFNAYKNITKKDLTESILTKCDKKTPDKEKITSGLKNKNLMSDKEFMIIRKNIIEHLIIKNNTDSLDDLEQNIFNNLYNLLYSRNDVYFKDMRYKEPNVVWGYKIINKKTLDYFKFNPSNNTFISATKDEIKSINKSFNKKIGNFRPPANIIGYIELKQPQNTMVFKIRNKIGEGEKGTQIKTGSICNNDGMKKTTVIDIIHNLTNSKIYDKISKSKLFLCNQLEAIFKYNDIIDKNNKWFYGPEETIEFKVNEKIK
jgi:hypothetical protein